MRNYTSCLLFLLFTTLPSANQKAASNYEWQLYDINKDGKFDKTDIDLLNKNIWEGNGHDINRDGKKDIFDALYLNTKLSVLDRSCNGVVNDEDFRPAVHVALPAAPDTNAISLLVAEIVSKSAECLPADFETQIFRSVADGKVLSPDEKAYLYQLVGINSLAKRNLEAAKWGFGKAYEIKSESSLPSGNLAFCLAMEARYDDALMLLANARKLFPRSAATSTTIGWIFARHGQNEEARNYYEEAVLFSPKTGQYHFNLGIVLLRLGKNREAWEEFKKGSEQDSDDYKNFFFAYITTPDDISKGEKPFNLEELREQWDAQISAARSAGWSEDEIPDPWDKMSCCDQAQAIPLIISEKYSKQIEEKAQVIANDLARKIEDVIKPYMPEWKDLCKDWEKFTEGVPYCIDKARELEINASIEAGNEEAALVRKEGAEILSYNSFFMNCALKEAEANYKIELEKWEGWEDLIPAKTLAKMKSDAREEPFKNAFEQCYKRPIQSGYGCLKAKSKPQLLPRPEVNTISLDAFLSLFFILPLAPLKIKGYYHDEKCYTSTDKIPQSQSITTVDVFSIDLWIISIEYHSESGEWEFNTDLGITLGATWNPTTGFGFQMGLDVDVGFIAGFEAGIYFKYDEGKWTYEKETGLSTGIGPFSYAREASSNIPITNFQAVPEETGSL